MSEIIVTTTVDKKALDAFFKYQVFTVQRSYIQCILFAILFAGSLVVGIISGRWISYLVAVVTLAGALMPILTWKMVTAKALSGNTRVQSGIQAVYRWSEEGLTEEEEGREEPVKLGWDEIYKICETKDYYFIYIEATQAFPMSKETMTQEEIQKVSAMMKEKAAAYVGMKR